MNDICIELAKIVDINRILEIYAKARIFMKESGNETQWGEYYPSNEIILNDIKDKALYVIKQDEIIHGVFAFRMGIDQTYLKIYEGNWMDDSKYGVIHRITSDNKIKGILDCVPLLYVSLKLNTIKYYFRKSYLQEVF